MTTNGSWVDNLAVFIIFIGLLALGSTTFIGALFTQPFATIFLMSVYDEKKGKGEDVVVEKEVIKSEEG
jgi:signal recognition particle receptor subunit beta